MVLPLTEKHAPILVGGHEYEILECDTVQNGIGDDMHRVVIRIFGNLALSVCGNVRRTLQASMGLGAQEHEEFSKGPADGLLAAIRRGDSTRGDLGMAPVWISDDQHRILLTSGSMGVDSRDCTAFLVKRTLVMARQTAERDPEAEYVVDARGSNLAEAMRLLALWRPVVTADDAEKCDRGDISPLRYPGEFVLHMSAGGFFGVMTPGLTGYKILGLHVHHSAVGCPFHVVRGKEGVRVIQDSLLLDTLLVRYGDFWAPRVRTIHEAEDTIPGFVAKAFLDDLSDEALAKPVDPAELETRPALRVTATGIVGEPAAGA